MKRIFAISAVFGAMLTLPMPTKLQAQQGTQPLSLFAAQWVQWALSLPNDVNPVVDTTGNLCMVGQEGSVWFLAGALFGGTISRTCTVPEGTKLFFPVINGFAFNTPAPGCGQNGDLTTVDQVEQFYYNNVTGFINNAINIFATLNNNKINVQRVQSVPFAVFYPPEGVFGPEACVPAPKKRGVPLAPGIYSPGIADGYWVLLGEFEGLCNSVYTTLSRRVWIHYTRYYV
jgi:hypothetical protein